MASIEYVKIYSGLVKSRRYAKKLRKVISAKLNEYVRKGYLDTNAVQTMIGEINRIIYVILQRISPSKESVLYIFLELEVDLLKGRITISDFTIDIYEPVSKIPFKAIKRAIGQDDYVYQVGPGVFGNLLSKNINS